jgi:hypothetical protein
MAVPTARPTTSGDGHDWSDVVDWRRRVADLYRWVRDEPDPATAHAGWARGRARLLLTHPASPVPASRREGAAAPPVAPCDPAFRFTVPVDRDVQPERRDVPTGTDGVVSFEPVGRVDLTGLGPRARTTRRGRVRCRRQGTRRPLRSRSASSRPIPERVRS